MDKYIGTKIIEAKSMNRGDYNKYCGWDIPENENPDDEGYLVKHSDGYESWSPEKQFNDAYHRCDNMTFGLAIEAMKKGLKVARKGWNGKGMFLYYVPENKYLAVTKAGKEIADNDLKVNYGAYIAMYTAQKNVVPWLASQTDMLSEDWEVIE